MGKEGKYDLTFASPPSPVISDTDSDEASEQGALKFKRLTLLIYKFQLLGGQMTKDSQLIKLLKESCINFLQVLVVSSGLTKNNLHPSSVHSLSSLLCSVLKKGQEWCNLTLVRSIAQTQQICRAFSTKAWTDMLLGFLLPAQDTGGNEIGLPKQVKINSFVKMSWYRQYSLLLSDINREIAADSINVLGFRQSRNFASFGEAYLHFGPYYSNLYLRYRK